MPKKFDGDAALLSKPQEHPELMTFIGVICVEWASLEMLLSFRYAELIFGDMKGASRGDGELDVIEAFESVSSWTTKKKLMVNAAKRRLGDESAKQLGKLLSTFDKVQQQRNNVVHARWLIPDGEPRRWVRKRALVTQDEPELWTTDDFLNLQLAIAVKMRDLNLFFKKLRPRLKRRSAKTLGEALAEGAEEGRRARD